MKFQLKTLRFLGKDMPYLEMPDGSNLMFIRLICEALGVDNDWHVRAIKADEIFGPEVCEHTTQLPGQTQSRAYTCLPEEYIYGWIMGIKASNTMAEETKRKLTTYKREGYHALYQHFHGYIAPVKQAVTRKAAIAAELARLHATLETNSPEVVQRIRQLVAENKAIGNPLQRLQNTQFKLAYDDAREAAEVEE